MEIEAEPVEIDLLAEFLAGDSIPPEDLMVRGLRKERIKTLFDANTADTGI